MDGYSMTKAYEGAVCCVIVAIVIIALAAFAVGCTVGNAFTSTNTQNQIEKRGDELRD